MCVHVSVCVQSVFERVCQRERERERGYVCVFEIVCLGEYVFERQCVCQSVHLRECVREKERERESVCVWVCVFEIVCLGE